MITLPDVVFFPQAILPLHIFEPRYRRMLSDVLDGTRVFAVAGLNEEVIDENQPEPPHRIATAGMIRACQKRSTGNSDLLLQGVCRVRIEDIVQEIPYRLASISVLTSPTPTDPGRLTTLKNDLVRLLTLRHKFVDTDPPGFDRFLKSVDDPEALADLAAFTLCQNPRDKQRLLETLEVERRLELFNAHLRDDIVRLKLDLKFRGSLSTDEIGRN